MKKIAVFFYIILQFGVMYAQDDIESKEDNSLRVMCYNVRNCLGMDEVVNYERVADVINRVAPDVVAVQEIDSATQRSKGFFVLKELAERTLMHWTYGPAIDFQGGKYGVGILSKEKPVSYRTVPLPGREEPRLLLIAEFEAYVLCCTHFSLTDADREASVPIIIDAVKNIRKPLFLAGDMNCAYDSPTQTILRQKFITLSDPKAPTWPSSEPRKCIDYIYGYDNGNAYTILQRKVLSNEDKASDHLPLFVDIRLRKEETGIFRTKPYLQNPIGNGITISWLSNVPTHSWVEYGTSANMLNQRQETLVDGQVVCNNKHHKIRLTNLEPGKTYYYRVCSREMTLYQAYRKEFGFTAISDIYTFKLPADNTTEFTAVIFNDLHKNKGLVDAFSKQLVGYTYDFVIFNGDCISDPKNENDAVDFMSYLHEKVDAPKKPVFYIRGNHEIRNAYSIQLRSLFDYVNNQTYNAFNWGDTRFVQLDCGEDKPDSTSVYYGLNNFNELRQEQVTFLNREIKGKAYKKATRKILLHHIPVFGMSQKDYNPCRELWGDILDKSSFDICLNGHTHQYAYHPTGSMGNPFPVVIGGGNKTESATMMFLQKTGKRLILTVYNAKGELLTTIDL